VDPQTTVQEQLDSALDRMNLADHFATALAFENQALANKMDELRQRLRHVEEISVNAIEMEEELLEARVLVTMYEVMEDNTQELERQNRNLKRCLAELARVVCGAGRPPWPLARPVRPIDLRARPVRVKRALTGGHGKSDLPYPRWLPPGPPRHRGSRRGCNGAYGMSGADLVGDNGKAGADGKDGRARTPMAQTVLWARTEAASTGMWARTLQRV
jgi:hypothetical protein